MGLPATRVTSPVIVPAQQQAADAEWIAGGGRGRSDAFRDAAVQAGRRTDKHGGNG